eukprot:TRINITY_DN36851_c0_g1_i2.p1 TRINITY_DN36851_c0_g1~~TRINITY_DN36851_c0_g1_i2.p1  ORF type:complete len:4654 (-),score=187.39 TRINITY_DN36851_c0_g1_i2:9376-23310(-)
MNNPRLKVMTACIEIIIINSKMNGLIFCLLVCLSTIVCATPCRWVLIPSFFNESYINTSMPFQTLRLFAFPDYLQIDVEKPYPNIVSSSARNSLTISNVSPDSVGPLKVTNCLSDHKGYFLVLAEIHYSSAASPVYISFNGLLDHDQFEEIPKIVDYTPSQFFALSSKQPPAIRAQLLTLKEGGDQQHITRINIKANSNYLYPAKCIGYLISNSLDPVKVEFDVDQKSPYYTCKLPGDFMASLKAELYLSIVLNEKINTQFVRISVFLLPDLYAIDSTRILPSAFSYSAYKVTPLSLRLGGLVSSENSPPRLYLKLGTKLVEGSLMSNNLSYIFPRNYPLPESKPSLSINTLDYFHLPNLHIKPLPDPVLLKVQADQTQSREGEILIFKVEGAGVVPSTKCVLNGIKTTVHKFMDSNTAVCAFRNTLHKAGDLLQISLTNDDLFYSNTLLEVARFKPNSAIIVPQPIKITEHFLENQVILQNKNVVIEYEKEYSFRFKANSSAIAGNRSLFCVLDSSDQIKATIIGSKIIECKVKVPSSRLIKDTTLVLKKEGESARLSYLKVNLVSQPIILDALPQGRNVIINAKASVNQEMHCYINQTIMVKAEYNRSKNVWKCELPLSAFGTSQSYRLSITHNGLDFSEEVPMFYVAAHNLKAKIKRPIEFEVTEEVLKYLQIRPKAKLEAVYELKEDIEYTSADCYVKAEHDLICKLPKEISAGTTEVHPQLSFNFSFTIDDTLNILRSVPLTLLQSPLRIISVSPLYAFKSGGLRYQEIVLSSPIIGESLDVQCQYGLYQPKHAARISSSSDTFLCETPPLDFVTTLPLKVFANEATVIATLENAVTVLPDVAPVLLNNRVNPYLEYTSVFNILQKLDYHILAECTYTVRRDMNVALGITVEAVIEEEVLKCPFGYLPAGESEVSIQFYYGNKSNPIYGSVSRTQIVQMPRMTFFGASPQDLPLDRPTKIKLNGEHFNLVKDLSILDPLAICEISTKIISDTEIELTVKNCNEGQIKLKANFAYSFDNKALTVNTGLALSTYYPPYLISYEVLKDSKLLLHGVWLSHKSGSKCKFTTVSSTIETTAIEVNATSVLCPVPISELHEGNVIVSYYHTVPSNELTIPVAAVEIYNVFPKLVVIPKDLLVPSISFSISGVKKDSPQLHLLYGDFATQCNVDSKVTCPTRDLFKQIAFKFMAGNVGSDLKLRVYSPEMLLVQPLPNIILPIIPEVHLVSIFPQVIYSLKDVDQITVLSAYPLSEYIINNAAQVYVSVKLYPSHQQVKIQDFRLFHDSILINSLSNVLENYENDTVLEISLKLTDETPISSSVQLFINLGPTISRAGLLELNSSLPVLYNSDAVPELNTSFPVLHGLTDFYPSIRAEVFTVPKVVPKFQWNYRPLPRIVRVEPNVLFILQDALEAEFGVLIHGENFIEEAEAVCMIKVAGLKHVALTYESNSVYFLNSTTMVCTFRARMSSFAEHGIVKGELWYKVQAGITNTVSLVFVFTDKTMYRLESSPHVNNYEIYGNTSLIFSTAAPLTNSSYYCIFDKTGVTTGIHDPSKRTIECLIPRTLFYNQSAEVTVHLMSTALLLSTKITLYRKSFPSPAAAPRRLMPSSTLNTEKYAPAYHGYDIVEYNPSNVVAAEPAFTLALTLQPYITAAQEVYCAYYVGSTLMYSPVLWWGQNKVTCDLQIGKDSQQICASLFSKGLDKFVSKSVCVEVIQCPYISSIYPERLFVLGESQKLKIKLEQLNRKLTEQSVIVFRTENGREFFSTLQHMKENVYMATVNPLIANEDSVGLISVALRTSKCESLEWKIPLARPPRVFIVEPTIVFEGTNLAQNITFDQSVAEIAESLSCQYDAYPKSKAILINQTTILCQYVPEIVHSVHTQQASLTLFFEESTITPSVPIFVVKSPYISMQDTVFSGTTYRVEVLVENWDQTAFELLHNLTVFLELNDKLRLSLVSSNTTSHTLEFSGQELDPTIVYTATLVVKYDSYSSMKSNSISNFVYTTENAIVQVYPSYISAGYPTELTVRLDSTLTDHIYIFISEESTCEATYVSHNFSQPIYFYLHTSAGCYKGVYKVQSPKTVQLLIKASYARNTDPLSINGAYRVACGEPVSILPPDTAFYLNNIHNEILVQLKSEVSSCPDTPVRLDAVCGGLPCYAEIMPDNKTVSLRPIRMNSSDIRIGIWGGSQYDATKIKHNEIQEISYAEGKHIYAEHQTSVKIKMNFIIEEHAKEVVNSFVAVFNTSEESYTTSELYYDPSVRVLSVALPEAFRNELAQYNVSTSFTALLNCVLNNVSYPVASLEFVSVPPIRISKALVMPHNYVAIHGSSFELVKFCQVHTGISVLPILYNSTYAECGPFNLTNAEPFILLTLTTIYGKVVEHQFYKGISFTLTDVSPTLLSYPMATSGKSSMVNISLRLNPVPLDKGVVCSLKGDIGAVSVNATKFLTGYYSLQNIDLIKTLSKIVSLPTKIPNSIAIRCKESTSITEGLPYILPVHPTPLILEMSPPIYFEDVISVNAICSVSLDAAIPSNYSIQLAIDTNYSSLIPLYKTSEDSIYVYDCNKLPKGSGTAVVSLYENEQYLSSLTNAFVLFPPITVKQIEYVYISRPALYITLSDFSWVTLPGSSSIINNTTAKLKNLHKPVLSNFIQEIISVQCQFVLNETLVCEFEKMRGYFDTLEILLGYQQLTYNLVNPISTSLQRMGGIRPNNMLIQEPLIISPSPPTKFCYLPTLNVKIQTVNGTCNLESYRTKFMQMLSTDSSLDLTVISLDPFGQAIGSDKITLWTVPVLRKVSPSVIQYNLDSFLSIESNFAGNLSFALMPDRIPLSITAQNQTHVSLHYKAVSSKTSLSTSLKIGISVNDLQWVTTTATITLTKDEKPKLKGLSRTILFHSPSLPEQSIVVYGENFHQFPNEQIRVKLTSKLFQTELDAYLLVDSDSVVFKVPPALPPDDYYVSVANYEAGEYSVEAIALSIWEKPAYVGKSVYSLGVNSDTTLTLPFKKLRKDNMEGYYGCIAQDQPLVKDESDPSEEGVVKCRFVPWGLPKGTSNVSVYFVYSQFSLDLIGTFGIKLVPAVRLDSLVSSGYALVNVPGRVRIKGENFMEDTTFCRFISEQMQNEAKDYISKLSGPLYSVYDYYVYSSYPPIQASVLSPTEIICDFPSFLAPERLLIVVTNNEPPTHRPSLAPMQHIKLGSSTHESTKLTLTTYSTPFFTKSQIKFVPNYTFTGFDADFVVSVDGATEFSYNKDFRSVPGMCELVSSTGVVVIVECNYIDAGLSKLLVKTRRYLLNEGKYKLQLRFFDGENTIQIIHDGILEVVQPPAITKLFPSTLVAGANATFYIFGLNFTKLGSAENFKCVLVKDGSSKYFAEAKIINAFHIECVFVNEFIKYEAYEAEYTLSLLYRNTYLPLDALFNSTSTFKWKLKVLNPREFAAGVNQTVVTSSSIEVVSTLGAVNNAVFYCRYRTVSGGKMLDLKSTSYTQSMILCPPYVKTEKDEEVVYLSTVLEQSEDGISVRHTSTNELKIIVADTPTILLSDPVQLIDLTKRLQSVILYTNGKLYGSTHLTCSVNGQSFPAILLSSPYSCVCEFPTSALSLSLEVQISISNDGIMFSPPFLLPVATYTVGLRWSITKPSVVFTGFPTVLHLNANKDLPIKSLALQINHLTASLETKCIGSSVSGKYSAYCPDFTLPIEGNYNITAIFDEEVNQPVSTGLSLIPVPAPIITKLSPSVYIRNGLGEVELTLSELVLTNPLCVYTNSHFKEYTHPAVIKESKRVFCPIGPDEIGTDVKYVDIGLLLDEYFSCPVEKEGRNRLTIINHMSIKKVEPQVFYDSVIGRRPQITVTLNEEIIGINERLFDCVFNKEEETYVRNGQVIGERNQVVCEVPQLPLGDYTIALRNSESSQYLTSPAEIHIYTKPRFGSSSPILARPGTAVILQCISGVIPTYSYSAILTYGNTSVTVPAKYEEPSLIFTVPDLNLTKNSEIAIQILDSTGYTHALEQRNTFIYLNNLAFTTISPKQVPRGQSFSQIVQVRCKGNSCESLSSTNQIKCKYGNLGATTGVFIASQNEVRCDLIQSENSGSVSLWILVENTNQFYAGDIYYYENFEQTGIVPSEIIEGWISPIQITGKRFAKGLLCVIFYPNGAKEVRPGRYLSSTAAECSMDENKIKGPNFHLLVSVDGVHLPDIATDQVGLVTVLKRPVVQNFKIILLKSKGVSILTMSGTNFDSIKELKAHCVFERLYESLVTVISQTQLECNIPDEVYKFENARVWLKIEGVQEHAEPNGIIETVPLPVIYKAEPSVLPKAGNSKVYLETENVEAVLDKGGKIVGVVEAFPDLTSELQKDDKGYFIKTQSYPLLLDQTRINTKLKLKTQLGPYLPTYSNAVEVAIYSHVSIKEVLTKQIVGIGRSVISLILSTEIIQSPGFTCKLTKGDIEETTKYVVYKSSTSLDCVFERYLQNGTYNIQVSYNGYRFSSDSEAVVNVLHIPTVSYFVNPQQGSLDPMLKSFDVYGTNLNSKSFWCYFAYYSSQKSTTIRNVVPIGTFTKNKLHCEFTDFLLYYQAYIFPFQYLHSQDKEYFIGRSDRPQGLLLQPVYKLQESCSFHTFYQILPLRRHSYLNPSWVQSVRETLIRLIQLYSIRPVHQCN